MELQRKKQKIVNFCQKEAKNIFDFCRCHPLGALLFSLAAFTNVFAHGDRLLITCVKVGTIYTAVQVTNFEERSRSN